MSTSLQDLDVSHNDLASIDVTNIPVLRKLNLDNNRIFKIKGLTAVTRLETLSWRQQYTGDGQECSLMHIDDCNEVRNLFLSGNKFPLFNPGVSFLNLHHLELASTGLNMLSPAFGPCMYNLRILNLNHNALKNLQPLLGLTRLKKLYVAGNRISRLRRTIAVLTRISGSLEEVDFRGNPLTVGFYPQSCGVGTAEKRLIVKDSQKQDQNSAEEEDSLALANYLLPPTIEEADEQHRECLDQDTALRRRVYELLVVGSCRKLRYLDGLPVDRRRTVRRDGVWERLVELGVLKQKGEVDMEKLDDT